MVAEVLGAHGVPWLFGLSGGHISPIFVEAKRAGVRVVDTRHEATAVFAADAVSRLTGTPGVAVVTAGPGVTNTITAVKNAQLAESALVLIGGATATVLRGRGSLQDIDQMALMAPHVKWAARPDRLRDVVPALRSAFRIAQSDVPGPVFVELAVDLLYPEEIVRKWYLEGIDPAKGFGQKVASWYLGAHLDRVFGGPFDRDGIPGEVHWPMPDGRLVARADAMLSRARRPVLLVGSQAMLQPGRVAELAAAVESLGVPTWLSGMARGLLGAGHALHRRHRRRDALRDADLVILAGVPCDFRLNYGRHISGRARVISVNRDAATVSKNRVPNLPVVSDAMEFLLALARRRTGRGATGAGWSEWSSLLAARDDDRDREIADMAAREVEPVNPLALLSRLDDLVADDSILVGDGGDFVGTASYVVRPRGPLQWLDPGVFGTLGVGAGFALGARVVHPKADVWILYGDGAAGYSLMEIDTFARHGLGVVALVGNDRAWSQIRRDQVEVLGDSVGTDLGGASYARVGEALGGDGLTIGRAEDIAPFLSKARDLARAGRAVVVDALVGKTDFRKGSLSM